MFGNFWVTIAKYDVTLSFHTLALTSKCLYVLLLHSANVKDLTTFIFQVLRNMHMNLITFHKVIS